MNFLNFDLTMISRLILVVLLHFVWQATLICILTWIGRNLFRPSQFRMRYSISVAGLVGLFACAITTTCFYLFDANAYSSLLVTNATESSGLASASGLATAETSSWLMRLETQFLTVFDWFDTHRNLWLGIWLAGFSIFVLRLSWSLYFCFQLRRQRKPLPRKLQRAADRLQKKLNLSRKVIVASSTRISQAVATGIIKPMVLVPASWLSELPLPALEAVLAHEMAHIKRFDLWINVLQRILETIFFFHPMVWWLSKSISAEREICCDRLAVSITGNALQYVETLTQVAQATRSGHEIQFGTAFKGGKNMKLLRRAKMILEPGSLDATSPFRALTVMTCMSLLAGLSTYGYCSGSAPEPPLPQESFEFETEGALLELTAKTQESDSKETHELRIQLDADQKLDNRKIAARLRDLADRLDREDQSIAEIKQSFHQGQPSQQPRLPKLSAQKINVEIEKLLDEKKLKLRQQLMEARDRALATEAKLEAVVQQSRAVQAQQKQLMAELVATQDKANQLAIEENQLQQKRIQLTPHLDKEGRVRLSLQELELKANAEELSQQNDRQAKLVIQQLLKLDALKRDPESKNLIVEEAAPLASQNQKWKLHPAADKPKSQLKKNQEEIAEALEIKKNSLLQYKVEKLEAELDAMRQEIRFLKSLPKGDRKRDDSAPNPQTSKNEIQVLNDIPLVGRLFKNAKLNQ